LSTEIVSKNGFLRQSRAVTNITGNCVQSVNWLRVLGATEMPHINHGVGHQFHRIVPTLDALKPHQ
jgi:hypothetical protein